MCLATAAVLACLTLDSPHLLHAVCDQYGICMPNLFLIPLTHVENWFGESVRVVHTPCRSPPHAKQQISP